MSLNVFPVPSGTETSGITTGPGGNLFFTETAADKIGRITPADVVTEFAIPTPNAQPAAITTGPDGNLWVTGATFIGRITPKGAVTEFKLSVSDSAPEGITAGPDGNLYFAESSSGAGIGRITTKGVITEIAVPASGGITAGPDGNIWLTEDGKIAQLVIAKPAAASSPAAVKALSRREPGFNRLRPA